MHELIVENLEHETNKMGGKNKRYKAKHSVRNVDWGHIFKATKNNTDDILYEENYISNGLSVKALFLLFAKRLLMVQRYMNKIVDENIG